MEPYAIVATMSVTILIIRLYEKARAKGKPALILLAAPILAILVIGGNMLIRYRANLFGLDPLAGAGMFLGGTVILTACLLVPLVVVLLVDNRKKKNGATK